MARKEEVTRVIDGEKRVKRTNPAPLRMNWNRSNWKEEKAIIGVLFDKGMRHDVIFSSLFASTDEWEGGIFMEFPVYQEVIRDNTIVP